MATLLIKSFNSEATWKRRQVTLESRLIVKLFEQLIKREVKKKKGEPNRLQIAINVRCKPGREGETPPNQRLHACQEQSARRKAVFFPHQPLLAANQENTVQVRKHVMKTKALSLGGKKKIIKKKTSLLPWQLTAHQSRKDSVLIMFPF